MIPSDKAFIAGAQTIRTEQSEPWKVGKIRPNLIDLKNLLKPEDSLLDVGCGQGYAYDFLKHENYTGVDYYPERIAEAKARLPHVRFMVGDVYNLSGRYDVAFCSRLLVHLPRFEDAMRSLFSVARKCVITVKIGEDRVEKFKDHYFRWFSEKTLRQWPCEIIRHIKYSTVIYAR